MPDWLPQWVVDQRAALAHFPMPISKRIIDSLTTDARMQPVWRALDKRMSTYKAQVMVMRDAASNDEHAGYYEDLSRAHHDIGLGGTDGLLFDLVTAVEHSLNWATTSLKFSASEVFDRAESVRRQCNELATSFEEIDFAHPGPFAPMLVAAVNQVNELLKNEIDEKIIMDIVEPIAFGLASILREIAVATFNVSPSKNTPAQTKSPNAKRLFFLRSMREYFEGSFGQPLHGANIKIASLFFDDCEALTEKQVDKLTSRKSAKI